GAEREGLRGGLCRWEKGKPPQAGTDDLFYRAAWRTSLRAAANPDEKRARASWIIFADAKGVSVALADRLEASGHHCHLVYRDDAFAQEGTREWTVNERQRHDFSQLLEQFAASETLLSVVVVYLWCFLSPSLTGLPPT